MNKEYIKSVYEISNNDGVQKVDFQIKEILPFSSMIAAVNEIVGLLFIGDEYSPALRDYVYWKTLLSYYTDVNTKISPDELLELLYSSNLESVFYQNVNMQQIGAIDEAIQEAIGTRNSKSELDLLMRDVRYFIKRYEKVIDKSVTPKTIKLFFSTLMEKIQNFDFATLITKFLPQPEAKEDVKM